jgi:hypothetical protein
MKEFSRIFLTKRRIQDSHFKNESTDSPGKWWQIPWDPQSTLWEPLIYRIWESVVE